jgi:hypothetical protein
MPARPAGRPPGLLGRTSARRSGALRSYNKVLKVLNQEIRPAEVRTLSGQPYQESFLCLDTLDDLGDMAYTGSCGKKERC